MTRWMPLGCTGRAGTLGAILTGFFASSVVNPIFGAGKATGFFEGNHGQVFNQLVGSHGRFPSSVL